MVNLLNFDFPSIYSVNSVNYNFPSPPDPPGPACQGFRHEKGAYGTVRRRNCVIRRSWQPALVRGNTGNYH